MVGRELGISGSGGADVGGLTEGDSWVKPYSSDGDSVSWVMLVGLCRGGKVVVDVVSRLMVALSLCAYCPSFFVTSCSWRCLFPPCRCWSFDRL